MLGVALSAKCVQRNCPYGVKWTVQRSRPAMLPIPRSTVAQPGPTEPGERSADPAPLRQRLQAMENGTDPSYLLVAAGDDQLAGYVDVSVLPYRRARRTGYVVIGVRADDQAGASARRC